MSKHNYPKQRVPRDVSYSKSYKLVEAVGRDNLAKLLSHTSPYRASFMLSEQLDQHVSQYVIRYAKKRYNLVREHEENTI